MTVAHDFPERRPGPAIRLAHRLIVAHAEGRDCPHCQDGWCLGAEWALGVVSTADRPPPEGKRLVTVVARQILTAHRALPGGTCLPCGLPACDRAGVATAWLETVGELVPGFVYADTGVPTDDDLRRITGIDHPGPAPG